MQVFTNDLVTLCETKEVELRTIFYRNGARGKAIR